MGRPVHFEIHADDIERAKKFYAEVFGWTYVDYGEFTGMPYFGVITGEEGTPGINGGLMGRQGNSPSPGQGANAFVITIEVDDYDTVEKKILENGGMVAMPKYALTGMAWQGYYLDTEGNVFGIHHPDLNAR